MAGLAGAVVFGALALLAYPAAQAGEVLVYFGTYTTKASKGVYVSRLDLATGALSAPVLAAETRNPSFLAAHPTRPYLYAVNEVATFDGKPTGSVSAFSIERRTGALTALNVQPSGGADPAHLVVDRAGRHVIVANYSGGSVSVLPIETDGRLRAPAAVIAHTGSSINTQRQTKPYAHGIAVDPANRFALVADLGIDKVLIYRFDEKGLLRAAETPFATVPPGSGPRHVAIRPDGRFAYAINELTCTIAAFAMDASSGALREVQTLSTLPAGQTVAAGFSTAEIVVHPSGRFLYGSNRGHDTIAVFSVDAGSGRLSPIEHVSTQGRTPRGFGIDPTGAYLIVGNQRSDSVVVFRIDAKTGRLTPTGQQVEVGSPVSVEFVR